MRNYFIKSLALFSALFIHSHISAQNEVDVLRYSLNTAIETPRVLGMGGAYGALGADISSMGINPAGIGMYRRGDIGGGLGITGNKTLAGKGIVATPGSRFSTDPGTFGVCLTVPSVNPDFPFTTIGISHQKRDVYDSRISIESNSIPGSLMQTMHAMAEGTHNADLNDGSAFPFSASLAWYTYLLDPNNGSNTSYVTPFNTDTTIVLNKFIEEEGHINDTHISLGSTYQDWLSVGATLTLSDVVFNQDANHSESPIQTDTDLSGFSYTEILQVEGSGISLKAGAIARVTDWLRLGAAFHTGTRFTLSDYYYTTMTSYWKDGTSHHAESPDGGYEYIIITPSKLILSSSVLVGKYFILSADYEQTDYRNGRLSDTESWLSTGYDFEAENDIVQTIFNQSHEARLGVEARIAKFLRLRMGGGYATTPYSPEANVQADASRYTFSFGQEYRSGDLYFGLAWSKTWYSMDQYVLDPAIQNSPVNIDRATSVFMIGGGRRF
jgi:hypothetical protein